MSDEKQLDEAKKQLESAKRQRVIIIATFFFGLIAFGAVVSIVSDAYGKSDFGTNFLTEMMGAAITLLIIEIVFNRLENRAEENIKRRQKFLEETIHASTKHMTQELIPHMVANSLRKAYAENEEVNADTILEHLHQHNLIKNEHLDEFRKRSQGAP
jgi:uncharacterized membrane protein